MSENSCVSIRRCFSLLKTLTGWWHSSMNPHPGALLITRSYSLLDAVHYITRSIWDQEPQGTWIRRPFDGLSKAIRVTVTYLSSRIYADLFIYLGHSAAAHNRQAYGCNVGCLMVVLVTRPNCWRMGVEGRSNRSLMPSTPVESYLKPPPSNWLNITVVSPFIR